MSILVTGGAGYIGSHMVPELADAGERVVVLDNLSTGFDWAVPRGVPLIIGDTGDQKLVGQIIREHKVDSIIHFAASVVVPESVTDPLSYYKNNTVNSRALIESAIRQGVRHFIFSSTAAVYGDPAEVPVTEDTPAAPISPYGWSKLMTEIMLRDAGTAHGLRHIIYCATSTLPAPIRTAALASPVRTQLTRSRSPSRQRSGFGPSSTSTVPIIRRPMVPASAITSTSATLSVRMRTRCTICAPVVPR
jgi:dTDP-4-dehydrorhamnose reductase